MLHEKVVDAEATTTLHTTQPHNGTTAVVLTNDECPPITGIYKQTNEQPNYTVSQKTVQNWNITTVYSRIII